MSTHLQLSRVKSIERETWDYEIEEGDTCPVPLLRQVVHRGEH